MSNRVSQARRSIWIISPWCDLGLLVAAPVVIFPLVLLLANYRFLPEQIDLAVFAFASLGHHLPGMMRAYGDRELFARYRWRFLLAPPLFVLVSWTCFIWLQGNALAVILLFWATWHILMQTYGFLRLYDHKRSRATAWDARLDFWTCVAVFLAGIVFSDARVFGIAETISNCGLPTPSVAMLTTTRWVVGVGTGLLLAAYVVRSAFTWRDSAGVNSLKLLLLLSTTALYWATGQLSINMLIGVAMFEIFHALQYYAIVWSFNRRRAQRQGQSFGPLAFMFRDPWRGLPLYLLAIAAFGAIGFFGRRGSADSLAIATALFSASAMLHFYYDGFIWKFRGKGAREVAGHASSPPRRRHRLVNWHALQWTAFSLLLGLLVLLERGSERNSQEQSLRIAELYALTPALPEAQIRMSRQSLQHGDAKTAFALARRAVRRRPRSYAAHSTLGQAALAVEECQTARDSYAAALELRPHDVESLYGMGLAELRLDHAAAAQRILARCLEMKPDHVQARFQLGNAFYKGNLQQEAIDCFRRCTVEVPGFAAAYNNLAEVLQDLRKTSQAEDAYLRTLKLNPSQSKAQFQLGNIFFSTQRYEKAIVAYRRCTKLEPTFADAQNNLGAALLETDRPAEAADAYRRAIRLRPRYAAAHYNLGLALYYQRKDAAARRSVLRAIVLGHQPNPEFAAELRITELDVRIEREKQDN